MHAKATFGGQDSANVGRISRVIFPCIATVLFAVFGVSTAAAGESLVDVLKAQNEEVKTFRADVEMARLPGRDWKKMAAAYRDWAEYARRENVAANLVQGLLDRAEEYERGWPTDRVERLRYYWSAPGKLRIEHFKRPNDAKDAEADEVWTTEVFNGMFWKSYMVHAKPNPAPATLIIRNDDNFSGIWVEVARGAAVRVPEFYEGRHASEWPLSPWAAATNQITWEELLRGLIDEDSIKEKSEPPPSGGEPLPMLEMVTEPHEKLKHPLNRWKIWFDPPRGNAIVAVECLDLSRNGVDGQGDIVYLRSFLAEWSDPVELDNGSNFFRKCAFYHYRHELADSPANEDLPKAESWPRAAYERLRYEFTFSNVEINEPLNAELFDIEPIAGTNIIYPRKE